jgi:thiol-disulfide isomerase/thioredoxin
MLKRSSMLLFIAAAFVSNAAAVEPGLSAPECRAPTLEEQQPLDLTHYRGKVVYMDFWASWCPPCRTSFPLLNELHNELQAEGFEVVAINVDENREDLLHFLKQCPVDFTIAVDPEGKCPEAFEVVAMPSSYLIGRQGIIRHVHQGFRKEDIEAIRQLVLALLAEPS